MSNLNIPDSIIKLEKKLMKLAKDKSNAISSQKFETAAQIRDKERKVKIKLEEEKKSIFNDQNYIKPVITADDVADVVATMTGIPLSKVAESETTRLLNMSNELKIKLLVRIMQLIKFLNQLLEQEQV